MYKGVTMILKKVEDNMVVSAVEIKSFQVVIDDDNKATITAILDDINNSEVVYHQAPGDHHLYQIVDNSNTMLRLVHQ